MTTPARNETTCRQPLMLRRRTSRHFTGHCWCPRVDSNHHALTGTGPQPAAYTIPPRGHILMWRLAPPHVSIPIRAKDCQLLLIRHIVVAPDDAPHTLAHEKARDIFGSVLRCLRHDAGDRAGIMRRAEQVGQREERVIQVERSPAESLLPPGVNARQELWVCAEMLIERSLFDQCAACHIDEDGVWFHPA